MSGQADYCLILIQIWVYDLNFLFFKKNFFIWKATFWLSPVDTESSASVHSAKSNLRDIADKIRVCAGPPLL